MNIYQFCRKLYGLFIPLFFVFQSCEEPFQIDSQGMTDAIVFDGVITNEPPPYFCRLTQLAPIGNQQNEGIMTAQIVITDHSAGVIDTLKPMPPTNSGWGMAYTYYDYHAGKQVTVNMMNEKGNFDGFYVTTKLYGIEGHDYTLDILYQGDHYVSHQTMVPQTRITDLTLKEVDLGEKGKVWAPCISFINRPEEENYYLLYPSQHSMRNARIASMDRFFNQSYYWYYSVLSDERLEEQVNDFLVGEGEPGRLLPPGNLYPDPIFDSLYVRMQSISRDCYDGYSDMINQMRTDGGAYTPRPSSIRSNISGSIYGLFRVSAVSERGLFVDNRKSVR